MRAPPLIRPAWRLAASCPLAGRHQRAYLSRPSTARSDIIRPIEVKDDDGQAIILAQGECRTVHHLQLALKGRIVVKLVVALCRRIETGSAV